MSLIEGPAGPLHVVELGRPGDPPLVLLHGLFVGSMAQWYFTVAPALAPNHRVVLVDWPGHGRSPPRARGYDLASLVADLDAVVAALGLGDDVSLAGHSYGGLVALAYALQRPVGRLALLDVPLPGHSPDLDSVDPEALLQVIPGPVAAALQGGGRRARRLVNAVRHLATQTTLLADIAAESPLALEPGPAQPTLLVYGQDSGCLPSLAVLQAAMPQSQSRVLPSGHFMLSEVPDSVRDVLVEFFDG